MTHTEANQSLHEHAADIIKGARPQYSPQIGILGVPLAKVYNPEIYHVRSHTLVG